MRALFLTCLVVLAACLAMAEQPATGFDRYFEDATLRIDVFHVGDSQSELFTVDRLYRQGIWAGSRATLVDPFAYGRYAVKAILENGEEPIFTQKFDSYFGEYRTTNDAAAGVKRTYHETVLLPFPKQEIRVSLEGRRPDGTVDTLLELTVDPTDLAISREPASGEVDIVDAHIGGDPRSAVDFVILGEGYTASDYEVFRADLSRFTDLLISTEPYSAHRDKVNIRGVLKASREAGCDEPTRGVYRDTALGATFNSLGSERYMLTEDNKAVRDIAAHVPYDAIVIMVNHSRYGGGGIYNFFATFTAHNQWSDYVLVHELGHSFGGLADEYYSSSVAYNDFYPRDREPEQPNITALLDADQLKWRSLVTTGTEIPTPWEKTGYDEMDGAYQKRRTELNERIAEASRAGESEEIVSSLEQEAEALSRKAADQASAYLAGSAFAGQVGAFEGAGYSSEGLYRPMLDCIMFSKGVQPFCAVCKGALVDMIERYSN